ncbi:MAG TPA: prepilin-type N-terminal cleavage/methylation domain-containing protein [Candidatus Saccharimonadaceae bacterium]|nr:prepilin-type N-terminal cleavage/methylation domain-containing protein [Candidatus Saccharimonadaceae bacterium]
MRDFIPATRGFTLVELLIVIVVIAILAAITLVSYNGITQKANNTTTIQGVESYIKALNYYATENGGYPQVTSCLGTGYPGGKCLSQSGTAACFGLGTAQATALNTDLLPYMNNTIPTLSMQQVPCGGTSYIGGYAAYMSSTNSMNIYMILSGNQTCPPMSPNVVSTSTEVSGGATRCYYLVGPVS